MITDRLIPLLRRLSAVCIALVLASDLNAQTSPVGVICTYRQDASADRPVLRSSVGTRKLRDRTYRYSFADSVAARSAIASLRTDPSVRSAALDRVLTLRGIPDDPGYSRQDNLAAAGFPGAWEHTTGGRTVDGVPIVTAVLDAGFEVVHEDLAGNLWVNPGEIPGDGIDNDGNGLVDDVNGWNFSDDRSGHPVSVHGTQVAGILGAVGDNSLGVTGANWRGRLMLLSVRTVADVIAAYDYVLEQRLRFNRSGGAEGALVVVTNASFGIEGGTCADFPEWGALYDELGQAGVLSVTSAANFSRDLDVLGDMPADCPSDYLVAVTNVEASDILHRSAGYGRATVDIAAPGEGSYTTRPGSTYGNFGGTSAAAPYVAAAVSLLYATDCEGFSTAALTTEAAVVAAHVRSQLLTKGREVPQLIRRVASGAVLDVGAAQRALLDACVPAGAGGSITAILPNPARGRVEVRLDFRVGVAPIFGLYDALGRYVPVRTTALQRGARSTTATLDLADVSGGSYGLTVTDGQRRAQAKIIVLR